MTNEQLDLAARIERVMRILNPYEVKNVSTFFASSKKVIIDVTYRPMDEDDVAIADAGVCAILLDFMGRLNWDCRYHLKEDGCHTFEFRQN